MYLKMPVTTSSHVRTHVPPPPETKTIKHLPAVIHVQWQVHGGESVVVCKYTFVTNLDQASQIRSLYLFVPSNSGERSRLELILNLIQWLLQNHSDYESDTIKYSVSSLTFTANDFGKLLL